tara:strand:- start:613 stop:1176 length:564 start_codon:yes stop_codon:yes gene_type:complete
MSSIVDTSNINGVDMSIIDPPKEKEVIKSNYTEEEYFYESEEEEVIEIVEEPSPYDIESSSEEEEEEEEVEKSVEPVERPQTNLGDKLIIKTKHISEEEYKSIETDKKRAEIYWLKIDECIEEIEKFFIKSCDRDKDKITELSNIFYDWHGDEYNNIIEVISDDADTDKMCDKPFDILRDNLNQEAK